MEIEKLYIRSFGKIHDLTLELSGGLNVFYGKNESGKTTFYHFLKGMIYGQGRKRGKGAGHDDYSRYEPWDSPSDYGGTLWFGQNQLHYRLTRNFYRESPSAELLCSSTGERIDAGALEELLGNVSEAVYENTVSIGQLKSVTGPDLTRELTNYMAACQGAADSRINVEKAIQFLKMNRKGLQEQIQRIRRQSEQELEKLNAQAILAERELADSKTRAEQAGYKVHEAARQDDGRRSCRHLEKKLRETRDKQTVPRMAMVGGALGGVLGAVFFISGLLDGAAFFPWLFVWLILLLAGIVVFSLAFGRFRQLSYQRERLTALLRQNRENTDKRKSAVDRLRWNAETLNEQTLEKQERLEQLREEYNEFAQSMEAELPEEIQAQAVDMAIDRIRLTSGQIRRNLGARLRERTSEILREITDGKYREVLVDAQLKISVNTEERVVELDRLSRGTVEQIYFALRMASGELLCGDTRFPVILDDVFGMYDDERLCAVLQWLAAQDRQVILFTCSGREGGLLEDMNIPFHEIRL